MSEELHSANPGKKLIRTVDGVDYQRIPVKTHLITNKDDYADVVVKYAKDKLQDGDILFCSEKSVACTQNRAIPMEDIKPRKLAVTLSRYSTAVTALCAKQASTSTPWSTALAIRPCKETPNTKASAEVSADAFCLPGAPGHCFLGNTKGLQRYTATRYRAMKHHTTGSQRITAL